MTLDDTYQQITDLGTLTGHRAEAADAVHADEGRHRQAGQGRAAARREAHLLLRARTRRCTRSPRRRSSARCSPWSAWTNVADAADADGSKGGYPQLSAEALVKANPDLIFLADTKCCQQSPDTVKARAGLGRHHRGEDRPGRARSTTTSPPAGVRASSTWSGRSPTRWPRSRRDRHAARDGRRVGAGPRLRAAAGCGRLAAAGVVAVLVAPSPGSRSARSPLPPGWRGGRAAQPPARRATSTAG